MDRLDVLVFDVNETLLDLRGLQPYFEDVFGDRRVMGEWFGLMLRLSLVATITRAYRPFGELGRAPAPGRFAVQPFSREHG